MTVHETYLLLFNKTMFIGALCNVVAFSSPAPGPPFAAYVFIGSGFSILVSIFLPSLECGTLSGV